MIKNTYDGSYFLTGEEMAEALETLGEMRATDHLCGPSCCLNSGPVDEFEESRTLESELGADPVERPARSAYDRGHAPNCTEDPCECGGPVFGQHGGTDPVEAPAHYTRFGGPEPIEIAEHLSFCLGSVLKYIARAGHKDDAIQDLKKARFYLNREIARLERAA